MNTLLLVLIIVSVPVRLQSRGRLCGIRWFLPSHATISVCALLLAGLLGPANAAATRITTASLIEEMIDLKGMAEFPEPFYTCRQFSSYDRKSESPDEEWFANADRGQYLRVEDHQGRKEYVMMDADGPGAVVRIWSANPEGNLRIYLEGESQPVLTVPMADLLGGRYPGLPRPIGGEYSKGWNLYLPIPYSRHCKITSDKGDFYYHVNYRTYEPGTPIESFSLDVLSALEPRLKRLVTQLDSPRATGMDEEGVVEAFDFEVAPGKTTVQRLWGPLAISGAGVRVTAEDVEAALRGVILKVAFDGEPAVETPLGDFFGSAPGINAYATLPLGMTEAGELYSNWLMPFREEARIELINTTRATVALRGEVRLRPYRWNERSMHFHAKWRTEFDVPTRPMIDWNYLHATGRGVFAGVSFSIDNPVKDWWGEGDEKIYVDGETFPSHFGTGTEDYYGYAWCWPGLFTHAYHAQPRCTGPGNYGRTSVNRFHILDRIPFRQDFRFDMELWHWNAKCQVNLAVVAYWYARPGSKDGFQSIEASQAVVRPVSEYVVPRVEGALEGEAMDIIRVTGAVGPQDWDGLSAGRHLWWNAGMKPGDQLVVRFDGPKTAGRYRVIGHFLSARDYGIHQLTINGVTAGSPRDFYSPDVKSTGQVDLGVFDLRGGGNEFSATVVGANEQAVKAYMFGLDYLLLKPVD